MQIQHKSYLERTVNCCIALSLDVIWRTSINAFMKSPAIALTSNIASPSCLAALTFKGFTRSSNHPSLTATTRVFDNDRQHVLPSSPLGFLKTRN